MVRFRSDDPGVNRPDCCTSSRTSLMAAEYLPSQAASVFSTPYGSRDETESGATS